MRGPRKRAWPLAVVLVALAVMAVLVAWGLGASEVTESSDETVPSEYAAEDGATLEGELDLVLGIASASQATRYESERSLVDEARSVLEDREGRGDCVVAKSGYLDLAGRTWGCVLQGDGWAEVLVVSEDEESSGCEVVSWLMDVEDVKRVLGDGS